jgi:TatD DNase family protein
LYPLTDTHCHLYLPQFDDDRKEVIEQAINSGITRILIPGIDIKTSEQALNLCAMFPNVLYAAVGIHPNSKNDFNEKSILQLETLAKSDHVVAIGEIGLDYYRLGNSLEQQKLMFQSQLELASKLDLPVCIHNRDASNDVLEITEKWRGHLIEKNQQLNYPGVFHSFSGSLELVKKTINFGFYLGLSGPITYPRNHELRKTVNSIPLEKLLIETDSPYLPPHPFRGQRNLPVYVKYVAQQISEIKIMDIGSILSATTKNASDLFNWK